MRFVKRYERHSIRTTPKVITYHFRVVDQPLKDWLIARLYHVYDMKIPIKIPGWRRFHAWVGEHDAERWHFAVGPKTREKPRWRDRFYEWDILQDLRCYELSERNVTTLAEIEVDESTYKKSTRWALKP